MSRKSRRTTRNIAILKTRGGPSDQLDQLITGLGSADLETSCLSALKLGRHGGLESLPLLDQAIFYPDPLLEYCARTALEKLRLRLADQPSPPPAGSLQDLCEKLESPYLEERTQAVRDLKILGDRSAAPQLLTSLSQESDPALVGLLVRTLLSFRDEAHRDALLPFLAHAEPLVRAAVIEGFWGWDDPGAVQAIVPLLKDTSPKVRGPAFVMIIRRGESSSKTLAEKLLRAKHVWMRLAALYALGSLTESWARQLIVNNIRDNSQPQLVRALAREAIALVPQALAATRGEAPDTDPTVETLWTDLTVHLPALHDQDAVALALSAKDPLMRVHGLQNARRFPGPELTAHLTRLLRLETDPVVLATLVKAVARVAGPECAADVRRFLDHDDSRIRSNALEALTYLRLGPDLDAICKNVLLEDDVPRIQKQAAAHLFASDPEEAVRHFRDMMLGNDASIRQNALQILESFQDERLLAVLRDALKDPRREVYSEAYKVVSRVAPGWDKARNLLEKYLSGEVAGEVVEGEPVSAMLFVMNSPISADRIRAMSKLVYAHDPRVNVVLELNLTSRDPNVAAQAARTLRERHRLFTLPRLYLKLGEVYNQGTVAGKALVPQYLVERLPRSVEISVPPGKIEEERLSWVGKSLFDAFEEDIDLDPELRTICLDIRAALEQMGSMVGSGSGEPSAGVEGTGMHPRTDPASESRTTIPALATVASDPAATEPTAGSRVSGRPAAPPWIPLVLGGLAIMGVTGWLFMDDVAGPDERPGGRDLPPTLERSIPIMNALCLEKDPERFARRFKSRRVIFTGRLLQVVDPTSALVRSGTILFRVRSPPGTNLVQFRPGQICEITAALVARHADGSTEVEGTVKLADEI